MKHRYCMNNFTFYDRTGIAGYLEKMAADGWMLEKTGSLLWRFKAAEPQKINFAVTYFPSASAFDSSPSENQLRFRDFCEYTGWHHLADCAQMQIYFNENEDPVPIETDAAVETETIHKAAKKTYLPGYTTITAVGFFDLLLQIYSFFNDTVDLLSSPSKLCMVLLSLLLIIMGGSELSEYYRWHTKAKRKAEENGGFLETHDNRPRRIALCTLMLLTVAVMFASMAPGGQFSFNAGRLFFILVASVVLQAVCVSACTLIMKKLNLSAKFNRLVTSTVSFLLCSAMITGLTAFVIKDVNHGNYLRRATETYEYKGSVFNIYHDELPLYITDFMQTDYDGYSTKAEVSSTIFVSRTEAYQRPRLDAGDQPSLEYTIVDVKMPFLFDLCLRDITGRYGTFIEGEYGSPGIYEYVQIDPAEWYADAAYQLKSVASNGYHHTYLLVYGNRIVLFKPDIHIDNETKAVIAEKLWTK